MSEPWVWLESLASTGSIPLPTNEARHVAARRLRVDDSLVVFDGRGRWADAWIESIGKKSTVVVIESIEEAARPDSGFVVASAIPKGDRLSTLLQMLSQLGVESWQPLVLEDSAVRKLDPNSKRLVRILIESCKVAKRPWLLEVRAPCSLEHALSARASGSPVYFGDREGEATGFEASVGLVLVGPEAGFSESERRILRDADAQPRSFGMHNLRIETAVIAAAVARHLATQGAVDGER